MRASDRTLSDGALPLARALADPIRLAVLQHLMSGPAAVSELVWVTGVSQPNMSNHLAVLRERKLVRAAKSGRQHVYELRDAAVGHLIESLSVAAGAPARKTIKQTPGLAKARTCYDHLAGQVGVRLFEALLSREAITEPTVLRTLRNPGSPIELGRRGRVVFTRIGVDLDEVMRGRPPYAFACRDWTERRPHLGGRLGAALWARFVEAGWMMRRPGTRMVLVTGVGRRGLKRTLGVPVRK